MNRRILVNILSQSSIWMQTDADCKVAGIPLSISIEIFFIKRAISKLHQILKIRILPIKIFSLQNSTCSYCWTTGEISAWWCFSYFKTEMNVWVLQCYQGFRCENTVTRWVNDFLELILNLGYYQAYKVILSDTSSPLYV